MIADLMRYNRYEPCALSDEASGELLALGALLHVACRRARPCSKTAPQPSSMACSAARLGPPSGSLLEHCATPQQTHLSDRCTLECTLKEAFCSNCGQKKAEELKAATKASVAVSFGSKTLTFELRLFHEELKLVCSQIDEVEFELTCLLDKASGRWLLSVPGI
ncbi:hypothetical protein [Atopobium sp. oral taxon 416]|uniref:hypothetical protein n=1 Tax=Atopobium sp. oral taxon 416 TaxID=712157 RepID=UPI001BA7A85F|nr:hypothetical protein [Atopobium sp. oral taxon 416]QUC03403.1 hypothetical protein J4859_15850 [Atopobium sp. oral taxon 416]